MVEEFNAAETAQITACANAFAEAEVTGTAPSSHPTRGDIRHGFVYERVPHITLKSIANNAEIDVIWEKWQETLEPLREQINEILGRVRFAHRAVVDGAPNAPFYEDSVVKPLWFILVFISG